MFIAFTLMFWFPLCVPLPWQCCGDDKWGDWRPHLAMVLSNLTHALDLDTRTISTMGDTLGKHSHNSHAKEIFLAFTYLAKKTRREWYIKIRYLTLSVLQLLKGCLMLLISVTSWLKWVLVSLPRRAPRWSSLAPTTGTHRVTVIKFKTKCSASSFLFYLIQYNTKTWYYNVLN